MISLGGLSPGLVLTLVLVVSLVIYNRLSPKKKKICQILAELKCGLIVDPCYIIVGTVHCSENARGTQIPSTSAG